MIRLVLCTTIFLLNFASHSAFQSGAPPSACDSLRPNHGVDPQTGESPFVIRTSATSTNGGDTIRVTIESEQGIGFKGFFIVARDGNQILGEFLLDEEEISSVSFRNCGNGERNAVTHANASLKEKISFNWKAPLNFAGTIRFYATVVEERTTFWMNHVSSDITITLTEDDVYNECGVTKSCFGLPDGCISSKNCISFSAVIIKDSIYTFELKSTTQMINRVAFIALGLSDDNRMGQDSVIECVNQNGIVSVFTSVTVAIPNNYGARRSEIDQNIIRLKESRIDNGAIYCLVERDAVSEVNGMTFNLLNQSYHLVIASGSTASELSIGYHDINRDASRESILFEEDNPLIIRPMNQQPSHTLLLVHGSFMIVAWIGATSIGVFSARYMRKIWIGTKVFGKDIWFIVHQVAMSLTWLLTISGVAVIWIDVGEWRTTTHSLLGIVATVLCFIQPLSAFFRPAPDDDSRPIFNFMHGSVGKLAHFIAVITIFFASSMARADLPSWTQYVLISYVSIYFIFYAMLTNMGFISDIKQKQLNELLKGAARPSGRAPLTFERRVVFVLFSILIFCFVVTLMSALILDT